MPNEYLVSIDLSKSMFYIIKARIESDGGSLCHPGLVRPAAEINEGDRTAVGSERFAEVSECPRAVKNTVQKHDRWPT